MQTHDQRRIMAIQTNNMFVNLHVLQHLFCIVLNSLQLFDHNNIEKATLSEMLF